MEETTYIRQHKKLIFFKGSFYLTQLMAPKFFISTSTYKDLNHFPVKYVTFKCVLKITVNYVNVLANRTGATIFAYCLVKPLNRSK